MIDITIASPKFKPLINVFKRWYRYFVFFGGRGSGKSRSIAMILIVFVSKFGLKVACLREFQNSIEDSVYSLLKGIIEDLKIPDYHITKNTIEHKNGGKFVFKGVARNINSIKSMEDFDIFWIEEAQTLTKDSIKVLKPTPRKNKSFFILSMNPVSRMDDVSKEFLTFDERILKDGFYSDELYHISKVNYSDNRYFPEVLELERRSDKENESDALYRHIWEGAFYDEVENSIIKGEWFDAAIDLHTKLGFEHRGSVIVTHDPADSGDSKARVKRQGSVILGAKETYKGNVNTAGKWALDYAIAHNADVFSWDVGGMGIALQEAVTLALDGRKIDYHMFNGAGGVDMPEEMYYPTSHDKPAKKNKDVFKNRRAQRYWQLRDRFYLSYQAANGKYIDPDKLISVSSDIKQLDTMRSELCRIPLKHNPSGMIQIMSKEEMKKINIPSPGLADSVMMSEEIPSYIGKKDTFDYNMEYDSLWD